MTLEEGIKLRGAPVEIPDCSRDALPGFFKNLGFKTGVEIGVYKGEYTKILAKSGLEIYGVDPWLAYSDYPYYTTREQDQKVLDTQYTDVVKLLSPYPKCKIVRKTSMDAVMDFKDNSIDFVYIDGNHSFKYVAEDICEWVKKVKPGGFVCGHDYIYANPANFHVKYVVDAYAQSHALKNLWILGRKKPLDKTERRDKWRSWMFRKE